MKFHTVPYTRGKGLTLGEKFFPHWIRADLETIKLFGETLDFVYVPEEVTEYGKAWKVIKPGGHLVTVRRTALCPEWKGFDQLEQRRFGDTVLQVFRKRKDKQTNHPHVKKTEGKRACVVRYGGFGDMIQMSSVLPGLKDQGFNVTVMTTPSGQEIVKNDPYIDEWIIQDSEQVPNEDLGAYWSSWAKDFDRFINLSESVEANLLAMPNRSVYAWPKEARHALMNKNYLEMTHLVSGVPLPAKQHFYPTQEEQAWAEEQKGQQRAVLWVLAGSSVHKTWPHMDQIIARILTTFPDVRVFLSGDHLCEVLEQGWEDPRVVKCSGKWSIRQTLAFSQIADLVVGPETGVLNCVGLMDVPEVCFLSHSSQENLTKHWRECAALEPIGCGCYPCHQLHYGFDPCIKDETTGCALCQALIDPERVWKAVNGYLQ